MGQVARNNTVLTGAGGAGKFAGTGNARILVRSGYCRDTVPDAVEAGPVRIQFHVHVRFACFCKGQLVTAGSMDPRPPPRRTRKHSSGPRRRIRKCPAFVSQHRFGALPERRDVKPGSSAGQIMDCGIQFRLSLPGFAEHRSSRHCKVFRNTGPAGTAMICLNLRNTGPLVLALICGSHDLQSLT